MPNLIDRLSGEFDDPMCPGDRAEKPGVQNIDRVPLGRPGLLAFRTRQLQGMSDPQSSARSTYLSTPVDDATWDGSPVVDRFD